MIHVASVNPVKVGAVKEILPLYPLLDGAEVIGVDVPSRVSEQPKTLEETIRGAMNRAQAAFGQADLSVGLESGLMEVPYSKTGVMDVCACALYDGKEFHLGLSSAWESPKQVTDMMLREGLDMNQAFHKAGLTSDLKIGQGQGAVGLLTKGRLPRIAYTKQALITAMIHLENTHT